MPAIFQATSCLAANESSLDKGYDPAIKPGWILQTKRFFYEHQYKGSQRLNYENI